MATASCEILAEMKSQWAFPLALLPILVATPLLLIALGSRGHLDGHEVLVAQTAREMSVNGDYIHPTFSAQPRYQKPPLAYWTAAFAYQICGRIDEATARLPSVIATLITIAIIVAAASRWFGPRIGLLAGCVHATTWWTIAYGKMAVVDATLTMLVSVAIILAAFDRQPISERAWHLAVLVVWICAGLSVLAKGPVGLAMIAPTIVLYRWLRRRERSHRQFVWNWAAAFGLIAFLFLSLAWPIAVAWERPEVVNLWRGQSVDRFLSHWGPNTRPWYYYFYVVPALTLPWTGGWIAELWTSLLDRRRCGWKAPDDDRRLLLWLWFGFGMMFFSVSEGKREHYILPVLPPLSILAALGIDRWIHGFQPKTSFAATIAQRQRIAAWMLAAVVVGLLVYEAAIRPAFHWRSGAATLFERQRNAIASADRLIQFGSNDAWLVFPLGRPVVWARNREELQTALADAVRPMILAPRHRLDEVTQIAPIDEIDDVGPASEWSEQDRSRRLVLLRPRSGKGAIP